MDKSRRFCVGCGKVKTFKRRKKEEHSSCEDCGGFLAAKRKDKKIKIKKRRNKSARG